MWTWNADKTSITIHFKFGFWHEGQYITTPGNMRRNLLTMEHEWANYYVAVARKQTWYSNVTHSNYRYFQHKSWVMATSFSAPPDCNCQLRMKYPLIIQWSLCLYNAFDRNHKEKKRTCLPIARVSNTRAYSTHSLFINQGRNSHKRWHKKMGGMLNSLFFFRLVTVNLRS